ncbi:RALGAPB [Bugula neritina]|uniref:RALGAPB n=1 Tax=Bugula neritina TaxID=10212 RepID=A0A7J7KNG4_BUGNE|nr:RALGAPB [Bugula neritina]
MSSILGTQEPNTVKAVIRGPFGRQIWIVEPKSEQTGSSKPVKAARPKPATCAARPRIEQRWWPSSVDSIPLVKA